MVAVANRSKVANQSRHNCMSFGGNCTKVWTEDGGDVVDDNAPNIDVLGRVQYLEQ